jgi:hypothetical protein
MKRGLRLVSFVILTVAVLWLMRTDSPPRPLYPIGEPAPRPASYGSTFDPARCGSVVGSVRWQGAVPKVDRIKLIQVQNPPPGITEVPNSNTPRVSKENQLADAVVFLVGVDGTRSKPFDVTPTMVEVTRTALVTSQGSAQSRIGVVPRGTAVEFVSRETAQHSIRGRGAAFFTQMLPTPNQAVRRELNDSGIVELSSGSGYYWLRGYLVVSDHPYVAVTGADGSFRFDQVPDGEYEIHCWKANWHVERTERDPEWLGPVRLYFRPAVELKQRVSVNAGRETAMTFTLAATDFESANR